MFDEDTQPGMPDEDHVAEPQPDDNPEPDDTAEEDAEDYGDIDFATQIEPDADIAPADGEGEQDAEQDGEQ